MPVTTGHLASLLASSGIRHHADVEQGVIRVVLVTRRYLNLRSERLAILEVRAIDAGNRCRVSLAPAFRAGRLVAEDCVTLCGAAGAVVAVEPDEGSGLLSLAAEMPIEDGTVTARQLAALIDAVVAAAEAGQAAIASNRGAAGERPRDAA